MKRAEGKQMRTLTLLLVLIAVPTAAQETKRVEGNVYSCTRDGTRYYSSKPLEGADCRAVKYSFLESQQPGPGWVPMADGEKMRMYYREKDITRTGDKVTLWVLDDYDESQSQPGIGSYKSSIGRWELNCSNKTHNSIQSTYYTDRLGKGKPVGTLAMRGRPDPLYATPGSIGEIMLEKACAITKPKPKSKVS